MQPSAVPRRTAGVVWRAWRSQYTSVRTAHCRASCFHHRRTVTSGHAASVGSGTMVPVARVTRRRAMTTSSRRSLHAAEQEAAQEGVMSDAEYIAQVKQKMRRGVMIASAGFALMVAAPGFYFMGELATRKLPEHVPPSIRGKWREEGGAGGRTAFFNSRNVCKLSDGFAGGDGTGEGAALKATSGPVAYKDSGLEVGISKVLGIAEVSVQQWPVQHDDGTWHMTVGGVSLVRVGDEEDP